MSGCQKNKTEIMLDGQDTVSESETQDDTQAGNDATEDLAEAKISAEAELSEMPVETEPEMIFVDVCGAVMNPGVYELDGSSRVFQAIEAAGGFLPEAAASAVNQAQPVSDGQQIYVPTQEEAEEGALPAAIQPADPGSETTDANGVVNINTADASALKSLSGIGDAKAQAILTYREEHGFFSSIEEIMQVPGIKESTFSAIKEKRMSRKVLVVDDEKLIVKGIRFNLEQDGMEVDCAYDGEEAVEKAKENKYDIILLDLMLPKMDGLEVCQQIREFSNVPIVMLTAKGEDMDKILGLDYGADDYITKPFNILEVKARIKAIMRRARSEHEEKEKAKTIEAGDLKLDCESRRVFIAGKEINLTAKEFDVLELLVFNPNKVYSRENLLNIVWGYEYPGDVRTVDVHIRRLREKIEANPSEPKYVHTKWGVGYYFQA